MIIRQLEHVNSETKQNEYVNCDISKENHELLKENRDLRKQVDSLKHFQHLIHGKQPILTKQIQRKMCQKRLITF